MPVVVRGFDELQESLKRAGAELAEMTGAHARASQLVASAARPPRDTGRLSTSIRPAPRPAAASVTVAVPYGMFVEYGTSRMRARPFLRPAFTSTQARWMDLYTAECQAILDRVHT